MTPTLSQLCEKYASEVPMDAHRADHLMRLSRYDIARIKAPGKPKDFIAFARERRKTALPSTISKDIASYGTVLSYAKIGWGLEGITDEPIEAALPILIKQGLIGPSRRRTRVPTDEQVNTIAARIGGVKGDVILFQSASGRRISETVRAEWGDWNAAEKTMLVRDMKHPRYKMGNHVEVAVPDDAAAILNRQPRLTADPHERIFKINANAVQTAFRRACKEFGYQDLHIHDLRRWTVTKLLAQGRPVQDVMLVTGHMTSAMVLTTYNGRRASEFHSHRPA